MKNIKIEGCIIAEKSKWDSGFRFSFLSAVCGADDKFLAEQGYIYIAPYTIEIELTDGIDINSKHITHLQEKRKLILAENQVKLNAIDQEIQECLAIEHKAE